MLIQSRRHSPADLRLWAEYARADAANAKRLTDSGKIEKAKNAIREFLATGEMAYIGVSWGKDSVTVADLVLQVDPAVPLVFLREWHLANPHNSDVAEAFMKRHVGAKYIEVPVIHKNLDRLSTGDRETSEETKAFHRAGSIAEFFFGRRIMGIRREESLVRKISACVHGIATKKILRPILYWSNSDVFAYLSLRDLPVHPNYAMLGGGRYDREHIRVDCIFGPQGQQFDRYEWEKEYYPDVIRKVFSKNVS